VKLDGCDLASMNFALVDDDNNVSQALARILSTLGAENISLFDSGESFLNSRSATEFDIVFLDLIMPGMGGFKVLDHISENKLKCLPVVLSGYSSTANVIASITRGAFDFLPKPFDVDDVIICLTKICNHRFVWEDSEKRHDFEQDDLEHIRSILPGDSPAMEKLRRTVAIARGVAASTLIEGETGTGKELVARCLHTSETPFIALNLSSIPSELVESELFGHVAGAFTGAVKDRQGLIAAADGGTLFLDEINSLELATQAKLLRVLQDKKVRPLGSNEEQSVDFRLISASNQPLLELIDRDLFRLDLLHRINIIQINVPPLRERASDIHQLANAFLSRYCKAYSTSNKSLTSDALKMLEQHSWPGNVRELENCIERAVIFSEDSSVITEHIFALGKREDTAKYQADSEAEFSVTEILPLRDLCTAYSQHVLERSGGNKAEACRLLRIDYKTLMSRLSG